MLKIWRYNTIICFELNLIKFFVSLIKRKTTKQHYANNISARRYVRYWGLNACTLAPKLEHHPDTKHICNRNLHYTGNLRILTKIFSALNWQKNKTILANMECKQIRERKKETDKGPSKTSGDEIHCMLGKKDCFQSGEEFELARFKCIIEKLITAFQF